MSLSAREALNLHAHAPLNPWNYAGHIGVLILDFDGLDITDVARDILLGSDSESWSGMTLKEGETTAIVINPSHAETRQCSTLMHELAHILLKHVPARVEVSETGMLLLSDYSDEDESEADWLAAAMLLPRDALMRKRAQGNSTGEIATHFGVSESLCEWRIRMTGIDIQLRRSGR